MLFGMVLRRTGRLKEAIAALEVAVALAPRHLGAREALGSAYLLRRDPDQALEQLTVLRQQCGSCGASQRLMEEIAAYSP